MIKISRPVAALLSAVCVLASDHVCDPVNVDFIVQNGDAELKTMEDDIRKHLEAVGITVNTTLLEKDEFNTAMVAGHFNMAFTESWGPPYDPHSYAKSWSSPDEAHYPALKGLKAPMTQEQLEQKIDDVFHIADEEDREDAWKEILSSVHEQAIDLPFSGKRIPAVVSKRLSRYQSGRQQFDYPMHTLEVESGNKTITVSPGGQTGLFVGIGRLDPHTYRPNEFFANNWVYDGLVEYGANGAIEPSLATSWTVADIAGGKQTYTFTLREGVTFHDGASWNCTAAKMNFDNVLAPPLTTGDYHGWYGLPEEIESWTCTDEFEFVVTTRDQYYPLLQELTYIRPLRMLSPLQFVDEYDNDPLTQNSCAAGWGDITDNGVTVNCKGILGIAGTGRWIYNETDTIMNGTDTVEVVFDRNMDHWTGVPSNGVERMRLIVYDDHDDVKAALLDGTLDVVVGSGVLLPADIMEIRTDHTADFEVLLSEPFQSRIIVLNSNRHPTDELVVRKLLIHSVNKAEIIDQELYGMAEPADSLFPKTAPYCHHTLTPRWDYDPEKVEYILDCPVEDTLNADDGNATGVDGGLVAGVVIALVVVVLLGVFIAYMVSKEKKGEPLFLSHLVSPDEDEVPLGN